MVRIISQTGIVQEIGLHELRYAGTEEERTRARDEDDLDTFDVFEELLDSEAINGEEEGFIRGWIESADKAQEEVWT